MSRFFIGELSETGLIELIKPLLERKNTGMVLIRGKQSGEIYLDTGNIIHSKTAFSSGEEAFLAMMGWETGRLTFDTDVTTTERSILTPLEQLLQNWSNRREEWEKIREVIPSRNAVFRISMQKSPGDLNIAAEQWNVLALSNGTKRVTEIAETLGWDEYKTSRTIYELIQHGLLEKVTERPLEEPKPVEQQKRYVNGNFFPLIETELKKVMGPIASIIIEDKLTDFGEAKDSFPQELTEAFIQSIGEEIMNVQKRREFIKTMIDSLSS